MVLAVKLALAPVLLAQGVLTRARLPRLPEAEGPRHGRVGRGRLLRLLVAGDSSAAGVGVDHQRDALAAPLAQRLADQVGATVHWRLLAQTGLDTAQTLALLQAEADVSADVAVVVTGVNDVTGQVPTRRALAARQALADWLRGIAGARHVAFTPLPPVHAFPGLPQPLRWVAGTDAHRHNAALRGWTSGRHDVSCVDMTLPLDPSAMAADGFHPGARAYAWCAEAIAQHLATQARHFHPHDEETPP